MTTPATTKIENIADVVRAFESTDRSVESLNKAVDDLRGQLERDREARAVRQMAAAEQHSTPDSEDAHRFVLDLDRDKKLIERSVPSSNRLDLGNGKTLVLRGVDDPNNNDGLDGLLDTRPSSAWHRAFATAVTERSLARAIMRSHGRAIRTPRLDRKVKGLLERGPFGAALRAGNTIERIFSDSNGIGGELIFDQDMPILEEKVDLYPGLGDLFETISTTAPTVIYPFLDDGFQAYLTGGAPVSDNPAQREASSAGFSNRTFTVVEMAIRTQANRNAMEDSIIAFMPMIMAQFAKTERRAEDDVIVNGDATGTNDVLAGWKTRGFWKLGTGTSIDHRRHSTGLRARADDLSNTNDHGAAQTPASARAQRATLDSPLGIANGAYIASPEYYLSKMLAWEDFKELDSYGIQNATVINGAISGPLPNQVGYIDRTPIVISELVTADLAATGKRTGSGAKTGMLYVNRDRFLRIVKNGRRFESQTDITRNVMDVVFSSRWLFATMDASDVKNVHWSYNLG